MDIKAIATQLYEAEKNTNPIDPLTSTYPGISIEDAYEIQRNGIEMRSAQDGRKIVGKKIGLTSVAMQKLLGVSQPDYGHLFDHMLVMEGVSVPRNKLILPKIEGEIAFVLKSDLKGPGINIADVLRATEGVMASIEIVDSRIKDWKIKLPDTIADNASSAGFVLGSRLVPVKEIDLRLLGMIFEKNGEIINTGAGAAVWGHPAASVAWLANSLSAFDDCLKAGEIILSGAVTAAVDAQANDCFQVSFQSMGSVGVRFV
ncbi:MAG: 2-keto-4-pentenoate hydratase [Desulfomonilaceae bacterium]